MSRVEKFVVTDIEHGSFAPTDGLFHLIFTIVKSIWSKQFWFGSTVFFIVVYFLCVIFVTDAGAHGVQTRQRETDYKWQVKRKKN